MGFPDRDKADQDTRAKADAADGSATGDRVRIKPPSGRIVRPPRQTPPTPPAPEGKKTPFTRAGGEVQGPVKLGDEPERPTVDPELGLNWLGAEGGSTKPIGKSWATSPPKVVKPPRKTGPKAQPDLVGFQQLQGTHPGDRYVRVVRQQSDDFQRVGPGHLVATEDTLAARGGVGRVFGKIKRRVIGVPLSTAMAAHERLTKVKALAVLSSDALSSVAYATEEMLRILLFAGLSALTLSLPITGAIIVLIAIVGFSYRQTIKAYPHGGGAYLVSTDNLGDLAALTAGAALLIDYTLTVAVSISSAVAAMVSAFPELHSNRVWLGVGFIALVTIVNLRGIRESGSIFAVPTYLFLIGILIMIAIGIGRNAVDGFAVHEVQRQAATEAAQSVTIFLVLRAFASGCSAMTGLEAISDGVPAFQKPEWVNARTTLTVMVSLLVVLFAGISFLAHQYGSVPMEANDPGYQTIVSQIATSVFGGTNAAYYYIQFATMAILVLAANTAYSDFPRLAYFLARDSYMPRQYTYRGDRLAYSTGILTLGIFSAILLIVFKGETEKLIPLYAFGVFLSFTLSQTGMVQRWRRLKEEGWKHGMIINGFGAVATFIVTIVVALTKFTHGAWIVIVLIPFMVLAFLAIHRHYERARTELQAQTPLDPSEIKHTVLVPIAAVNRVARQTLAYARSISDNVTAIHITDDEAEIDAMRTRWTELGTDIPLVIIESPYRSLIGPLLSYIDEIEQQRPDVTITVVLPELVARHWWEQILHNQSAFRIKAALLFRPGTVVTSVPYHLQRD
jgi:amino acid transporter